MELNFSTKESSVGLHSTDTNTGAKAPPAPETGEEKLVEEKVEEGKRERRR